MLIKGYGDFGQGDHAGTFTPAVADDGGDWLSGVTNFFSKAVVPIAQAYAPGGGVAVPKSVPPAGMSYSPSGQLVPKQAGMLGGISTSTLLGVAAAGAVVLIVMRKGRRRR